MKFRNGFISNSSSSSFVVLKGKLDSNQIDKLYALINKANHEYPDTSWSFYDDGETIKGITHMDNFCLSDEIEKHKKLDVDDFEFWHG